MFEISDRMVEVGTFVALLAAGLATALLSFRWRRPDDGLRNLEEWGVGGRAFGNWVTWFLIGGGSITAYTFVAIPTLSAGVGALAFYAVPFALITMPLIYVVSTRFWSVAHVHGFVTSAEFALLRFGSRPLALMVAILSVVATIPYIAVQLIALRAVFEVVGVAGEWPLLVALAAVSVATFRGGRPTTPPMPSRRDSTASTSCWTEPAESRVSMPGTSGCSQAIRDPR